MTLHTDTAVAEGPPSLDVAGGVATIRLRRPSQRNALHDEDLSTLLNHFACVQGDPSVRVLVLTAEVGTHERPVFCAGYFVGGFESGRHDPTLFEKIPDVLERLRPLTVCALNGSVYGGATDIALACDLRLGANGSEFRMPAAALGLHYYPSGLRRYVSRLGLNLAKRAFLTAQPLSYEMLASQGLFEAIVAPGDFHRTLQALVQRLVQLAPLAAQMTKLSLNEIADGRYDEASLRAREIATTKSEDFSEGRIAFAQRRKPVFVGR